MAGLRHRLAWLSCVIAIAVACDDEADHVATPPRSEPPPAVEGTPSPAPVQTAAQTPEAPEAPEPPEPPSKAPLDDGPKQAKPDPRAPIPETLVAHIVRPGETVQEIAGRYDEAPRWLRKWNRLTGNPDLRPRTKLSVRAQRRPPLREPVSYTTLEGDTVASVAVAHGLGAKAWARTLRKKSDHVFAPGTELELWRDPTLSTWVANADPHPTVPAQAWSVGAPDDGYLANAVRIPHDPAWSLRFEHRAYGSSYAVRATVDALHEFRQRSAYTGPLRVWSMSRHYGGALPDHDSHQSGRDLDVKLPLRADLAPTLAVEAKWVDYAALWYLLSAFVDTGTVQSIFLDYELQARVHAAALALGVDEATRLRVLQYPRPPLSPKGLVRDLEGHDDHIHVRFSCAPWEVFCTDR